MKRYLNTSLRQTKISAKKYKSKDGSGVRKQEALSIVRTVEVIAIIEWVLYRHKSPQAQELTGNFNSPFEGEKKRKNCPSPTQKVDIS